MTYLTNYDYSVFSQKGTPIGRS